MGEAFAGAAAAGSPARKGVFLQPGRLAAFDTPAAITTILGSCVAICLWDAGGRRGGMNHYLLPEWPGCPPSSPRYGDGALAELLRTLGALGSSANGLTAKVFGGACVLEPHREHSRHLGQRNVEAARRHLAAAGIGIVAEETGGTRGRKVVFHTDDGSAYVRYV